MLAAEATLKERERDDRDDDIARLKETVGEMTMETELLREKIARLEAGDPFGTPEVEAMSQALSPSVDRVYGLARVARGQAWGLIAPKRRPGPAGPCDDATLLEHIKKAIAESRFTGEGYRKIGMVEPANAYGNGAAIPRTWAPV